MSREKYAEGDSSHQYDKVRGTSFDNLGIFRLSRSPSPNPSISSSDHPAASNVKKRERMMSMTNGSSSTLGTAALVDFLDPETERNAVKEKFRKIFLVERFQDVEIERKFLKYYYSPLMRVLPFIGGVLGLICVIFTLALQIFDDTFEYLCANTCRIVSLVGRGGLLVGAFSMILVWLVFIKGKCVILYDLCWISVLLSLIVSSTILDFVIVNEIFYSVGCIFFLITFAIRIRAFVFFVVVLVIVVVAPLRLFFVEISKTFIIGLLTLFVIIVMQLTSNFWYEKMMRNTFVDEYVLKSLKKRVKFEEKRETRLLKNLFPSFVVSKIQKDFQFSKYFKMAVIGQVDICDFTQFSSTISTQKVIQLINKYFLSFDDILGEFEQLCLIQNNGDGIIFGFFPNDEEEEDSVIQEGTRRMVRAGVQMMESFHRISKEEDNCLTLRLGIGSGWVMCSVIGELLFSFVCLGEGIEIAKKMETNCRPGCVKICAKSKQNLREKRSEFVFAEEEEQNHVISVKQFCLARELKYQTEAQEIVMKVPPKTEAKTETKPKLWSLVKEKYNSKWKSVIKQLFSCNQMYNIKKNLVKSSYCVTNLILLNVLLTFYSIAVLMLLESPPISIVSWSISLGMILLPILVTNVYLFVVFCTCESSFQKLFAVFLIYIFQFMPMVFSFVPFVLIDGHRVSNDAVYQNDVYVLFRLIGYMWPLSQVFSLIPNIFLSCITAVLGSVPLVLALEMYDIDVLFLLIDFPVVIVLCEYSLFANTILLITSERKATKTQERVDEIKIKMKKNLDLLNSVLPIDVMQVLLDDGKVKYSTIAKSCVCFSTLLRNFESRFQFDKCKEYIQFLDFFIQRCDQISLSHGCQRIKCLGGEVMTIANCPQAIMNYAVELLRFFIRTCCDDFETLVEENDIYLTSGISVGSVSLGVVGKKKKTIDCYGDSANFTARLNQTSERNKIQVSKEFAEAWRNSNVLFEDENNIDPNEISFRERGDVQRMKGFGTLNTCYVSFKL